MTNDDLTIILLTLCFFALAVAWWISLPAVP